MARPLQNPPPGFDDLSVDEQIEYIQSLWDRVAANADQLPFHEWQQELLAERLAAHRADPGAARPAGEAIEKARDRLASLRRP